MTAASFVRRTVLTVAAVLGMGAGAASAQTYYGGYNLGPDFGSMIAQAQRQQFQMNQQMQMQYSQVMQRTMQDPNCQRMYQQHRANGGMLSYEQFAAQYAETGGFSDIGMARYRDSQNAIIANERASVAGLRNAERERAGAQTGLMNGYARNQYEAGLVMQGQSTWNNPTNGQNYSLNYMGPATSYDPRTGQQFTRDNMGNQWAQTPGGQWVPMTPGR